MKKLLELYMTIVGISGDKPSGSDGMTMAFPEAKWDTVRGDVLC